MSLNAPSFTPQRQFDTFDSFISVITPKIESTGSEPTLEDLFQTIRKAFAFGVRFKVQEESKN